jgi:hypothetical protein
MRTLRRRYEPSDCDDISCSYLVASRFAVTIRAGEPSHAQIYVVHAYPNISISAELLEVPGMDLMYHLFPFYFFFPYSSFFSLSLFSEMFLLLLSRSYSSQFSFCPSFTPQSLL